MKKKKIIWIGTDFHYQESWYKVDETQEFSRARIANDADAVEIAIVKGIKRLIEQFSPATNNKDEYNPIDYLKQIIRENQMTENMSERKDVPVTGSEIAHLREGITRKHIPYCENGQVGKGLVSSVITG